MDTNETLTVWLSKLWWKDERDKCQPYQLHRSIMRGFGDNLQDERVLFRVDKAMTTVQSRSVPDWLRVNDRLSFAAMRQMQLSFQAGQSLLFRLMANPTIKRNGKRWGLHDSTAQLQWLERKLTTGGCTVDDARVKRVAVQNDRIRGRALTLLTVLFSGAITADDPVGLCAMIRDGIGSAKGLGCGLLTVF